MKSLPSNRVAALALGFTGLAQIGLSLAGAWPGPTTDRIGLIAGSVLAAAPALAHILGSIVWDKTPVGQAQQSGFRALEAIPDTTSVGQDHYTVALEPDPEPDYESVIGEPYPDQTEPDHQGPKPDTSQRAGGPDLEEQKS